MKDTYTTALLTLLTPDADASAVLAGFARTLTQRGHETLYGPVLRRALRTLQAQRPRTQVTVTNEAAYQAQTDAITAALAELGATTTEPTIVFDPTIVGGYIAEHQRRQYDNSYKAKLVTLYRNITK